MKEGASEEKGGNDERKRVAGFVIAPPSIACHSPAMNALLEVPAIRRQTARLSVADFHRLGESLRAELLDGILINKMPKSPLHRLITRRIVRALESQISPELEVWKEDPLTLADSEPEPDAAVVRKSPDNYATAHPATAELVVEVAISSLEIDRVKAVLYAEAGIVEYWIVCPEEKQVEVYRKPSAQGYAECLTLAAPAMLDCAALPGVRVDLAALFE